MLVRIAVVLFTAVLAPRAAVAVPNVPPSPILRLANAVIHAANTDDASVFAGLYAPDAVVVDEIPPFMWRGAAAGGAWWHAVGAAAKSMKLMHVRAINVRVGEFKASATDAYLVEPMTVTGIVNGRPFAESGTQTYTFHKTGTTWLISSQIWTAKS